ncbi:MAG: glycosyltransferase [Eubacterium sp.]|nr:glycosyltransferase [Eubacterium sp.]
MKILVAIPAMDSVPTQFRQALSMLQSDPEDDVSISFVVGSLVYSARNNLAKTAVDLGVDWVFWLDSDMVFPPDTLLRMLKTCKEQDIDFLTGVYFRRVAPFTPVLFKEMSDDGHEAEEFKEIPKDELFEVRACGFGCVLMKTNVIVDVFSTFMNMFTPIEGSGEDISFCIRARQCGYKVVADPTIPLGHVGHAVITRQYWEAIKN